MRSRTRSGRRGIAPPWVVGLVVALAPVGAAVAGDRARVAADECRTVAGLETRLLDLHRQRAAALPPLRPTPGVETEAMTPLERLLGEDGYLERGAVVPVGDVTVLVDNGTGVFGSFVNGFDLDTVQLSRQYYSYLGDDVDVLAFLPDFDHDSGTFAALVRNDVQGINRPLVNDSAVYGSAGRLQSVLMFSNFTRRPEDPSQRIPGDANTPLSLMAHEFGHRFSAFVRYDADPGPGVVPSADILGRGAAHWCFYHDSRSALAFAGNGQSSLEGNRWRQNVDGTWTTSGVTDGYSPLDLYLMGLATAQEVPPFFTLEGPSRIGGATPGCNAQPVSVPHQFAVTVSATRRDLTIDDILRVEGPRIPDVTGSQRLFRQSLVLVARQGRFPSPAEVAQLDRLRREWEPYFSTATDGRASVVTTFDTEPGPAAALAFVRIADGVQAGAGFPFALLALDEEGRVATGYEGTVSFSSSDPDALLPDDVVFGPEHRGFRSVPGTVLFARGGVHSLAAVDVSDASITGTRANLVVEDPVIRICVPDEPDPTRIHTKPWGIGATFSGVGGIRYQYLIHADAIGRPAMIIDLDWGAFAGPEGVEWENLFIKMANKPVFELKTQSGDQSLDRNFTDSLNTTTVVLGPREQRGPVEAGRVHMKLDTPFAYNGIDHLLLEVRYTGGGPPGLMQDQVTGGPLMLTAERLGPNFPVLINATTTVCPGIRLPSGVPPVISDVTLEGLTNQTATISWRTSPATNGRLVYGPAGGPLDLSTPLERFGLVHTMQITGLQPGTAYEAVAVSRDHDDQESRSAPVAFSTTAFSPVVNSLLPASLPRGTPNSLLRVNGNHFFDGVAATIMSGEPPAPDPGVRVLANSRVSETVLDLGVAVDADVPGGPRRVRVRNSDGMETISTVSFAVAPPAGAVDIDGSGRVDGFDLVRLARAFGTRFPDAAYDAAVDLDGDGDVDGFDLARLANSFGQLIAAP